MLNDRESFINSHDKAESHSSEILSTTEEREHNSKENNVFQKVKERAFVS